LSPCFFFFFLFSFIFYVSICLLFHLYLKAFRHLSFFLFPEQKAFDTLSFRLKVHDPSLFLLFHFHPSVRCERKLHKINEVGEISLNLTHYIYIYIQIWIWLISGVKFLLHNYDQHSKGSKNRSECSVWNWDILTL